MYFSFSFLFLFWSILLSSPKLWTVVTGSDRSFRINDANNFFVTMTTQISIAMNNSVRVFWTSVVRTQQKRKKKKSSRSVSSTFCLTQRNMLFLGLSIVNVIRIESTGVKKQRGGGQVIFWPQGNKSGSADWHRRALKIPTCVIRNERDPSAVQNYNLSSVNRI